MTLPELFAWAVEQSGAAKRIAPIQITRNSDPHDDGDDLMADADEVIGGLPYTIRFEKFVDQGWNVTWERFAKRGETFNPKVEDCPISRALDAIHTDRSLGLEFEICWAIVHGGHNDLDILYAVLGRPNGFREAAVRGLTLLRDKTVQIVAKQVNETSQRRETAGAAEKARAEDKSQTDTRKARQKASA